MSTTATPVYGITYPNPDTKLTDLSTVLAQSMTTVEGALIARDVPLPGGNSDWITRFAVSVRAQGAVGDGVTDDTNAFRAALSGGGKIVYVPAGAYRITAPLRIQANTWLLMNPAAVVKNDLAAQTPYLSEAVFSNGIVGNTAYATVYAGDGNIRVTGGTVDCSPRQARTTLTECFAFAHAQNILVENVTMTHGYQSHFLEFNAVQHGVVRNCTFFDLNPAGSANRECINIDSSTATGFPHFGAWDNTVCADILIEGCTFASAQDGIGSHAAVADSKHLGIKVRDCTFTAMSGIPVHAKGWQSGLITGCRVDGCDNVAVYADGAASLHVVDNYITGAGSGANARDAVVYLTGCDNVHVARNRITTALANKYRTPYQVTGSSTSCRIDTGTADLGTSGFAVETDVTVLAIDGTYRIRLLTDTATSVPIGGTELQGLALVGGHTTSAYAPRGLYWVRGDSTPNVTAIARSSGETTTLTTGVLTGTTSTAGGMALSAANTGRLYIENRSGSTRQVSLSFVTA